MKAISFFKPQSLILSVALCTLATSLAAVESAADKVDSLISSCPWIGLIADSVTYGPITIGHLDIEGAGRLVFCEPGEVIEGTLNYQINASQFDSWDFHHIVVGLREQSAQSCIIHSLGIWNREGTTSFSFNAPQEAGMYEICFDYHNAAFCSDAMKGWLDSPPSRKATIGILIVE